MIRIFAIPQGGQWIYKDGSGGWYRDDAIPVYREPQGGWRTKPLHKRETIWLLEKAFGNQDPNGAVFPEWVECVWDYQAGRWIASTTPKQDTRAVAFGRASDDMNGLNNLWVASTDADFIDQEGMVLEIKKRCIASFDGTYYYKPKVSEYKYWSMQDSLSLDPCPSGNCWPMRFWRPASNTLDGIREFDLIAPQAEPFALELPPAWTTATGNGFEDLGYIGVAPIKHWTQFAFTRVLQPCLWNTPRFNHLNPNTFDHESWRCSITFWEI